MIAFRRALKIDLSIACGAYCHRNPKYLARKEVLISVTQERHLPVVGRICATYDPIDQRLAFRLVFCERLQELQLFSGEGSE